MCPSVCSFISLATAPSSDYEWRLCSDRRMISSVHSLTTSNSSSLYNTSTRVLSQWWMCMLDVPRARSHTDSRLMRAHVPPLRYRCQSAGTGSGHLGFAFLRSDARSALQMSGYDPESVLRAAAAAAGRHAASVFAVTGRWREVDGRMWGRDYARLTSRGGLRP